jgi:dienelactone hydrolase
VSHADSTIPAEAAPRAPLNEQLLSVPVESSPPLHLQVTLFMPSHGGPFPLVVVNHGASDDPPNTPRVADNFIPYYFLSRGYAVALPMMRGYAGSEGQPRPHGCDVAAIGLDAARDIRKVLDYVKLQPGIDTSHIVVAGKSMGGWNTLAFGTLNPPDVKGLVSFAGGVKESDCQSPDASLISAARQFGAQTKLRSIWFFGDNDQIFATPTWHAMFRQYTAAGGRAELIDYGVFQKDAHAMTASGAGLPLWVQKADTFLASIGMPSQEVDPEYLPDSARAASAYADINDLAAVPYLNDKQRETLYRGFLAAPEFGGLRPGSGRAGQMLGADTVLPALRGRQHSGLAAAQRAAAGYEVRRACRRRGRTLSERARSSGVHTIPERAQSACVCDCAGWRVGRRFGRRSDQRCVGCLQRRPYRLSAVRGESRRGVGAQVVQQRARDARIGGGALALLPDA